MGEEVALSASRPRIITLGLRLNTIQNPSVILFLFLLFFFFIPGIILSQEAGFPINPPMRFTTHPAADQDPAVSPDGKWVVYASKQSGNWDLYLKSTGGGASIQLTEELIDEHSPCWSPGGERIALVSHKDDALGDIWTMKISFYGTPSVGKAKKLTNYLGYDGEPAFSADGKAVYFSSDRSGGLEIWRVEIKTGELGQITRGGGMSPAISGSGEMAFIRISDETPSGEIFLYSPEEAQREAAQLTYSNLINSHPSFSPEGRVLAISRVMRDTDGDGILSPEDNQTIWIIPIESAESIYKKAFQLTSAEVNSVQPSWGVRGEIYYAVSKDDAVDISRIDDSGIFGRLGSAAEQFKAAESWLDISETNALLGLEAVNGFYPDSAAAAEALYLKGVIFARRGEYLTAQSYFRRIMRDYAENRVLFYKSAIAYLQTIMNYQVGEAGEIGTVSNPSGFVTALDKLIEEEPPTEPLLEAMMLKADALFQMGVFSEALEIYTETVQNFRDFPDYAAEAKYRSSQVFELYGEASEVIRAYLAVLEEFPREERWNLLAIEKIFALEGGKDNLPGLQSIIGKYRTYTRLTASARLEIARNLRDRGESELALQEYELAMGTPGNDPLSNSLKATAKLESAELDFERGEFITASDILKSLIAEDSRFSVRARRRLVKAYIERGEKQQAGDPQLALVSFREAQKLDIDNLQAHRGYIETMNSMGNCWQAYEEYSGWSALQPDNSALLYSRGLALSYLGEGDPVKLEKSSEIIARALALDYEMIPAYLTLSYNYQATEELNRSGKFKLSFTTRVRRGTAEIFADFWRAITFQGEPQEFTGYEKAINVLHQALALNDERQDPAMEAKILQNLANNYYSLGEFGYENALRYYLQKLAIDSSFGSKLSEAILCEKIGRAAMFTDEFTRGRRFLKQSEKAYSVLGDDRSVFRLYLLQAELELRAGDGETSNEYFNRAIHQAETASIEIPPELYFTDIAFNWYEIEDWDKARQACDTALTELQGKKIPRPEKTKYNISFEFLGLEAPFSLPMPMGEIASLGISRSAEGFALADVKSLSLAILSASQFQQGEYWRAEEILAEKQRLAEFKRYADEAAIGLNNLAVTAYHQGKYEKSADLFLASIKKAGNNPLAPGYYRNIANLQKLRVLLTGDDKRKGEIDNIIEKAAGSIREGGKSKAEMMLQAPAKVSVLGEEGNYRFERGIKLLRWNIIDSTVAGFEEIEGAVELWDTAREYIGGDKNSLQLLMIRANIVCAGGILGDLDYARKELEEIQRIARLRRFNSLLWRIYYLQGQIELYCGGSGEKALGFLGESAECLENNPPVKGKTHPAIARQKRELYRLLVELNLQRGDFERGFNYAERYSNLELVEILAQRDFETRTERQKFYWSNGGGSVNYFRSEIKRLSEELRKPGLSKSKKAQFEAALKEITAEYDSTLKAVRTEDPEFASIFSVSPLGVEDIRGRLNENEALIRFFELENCYQFWALSGEDFFSGTIDINPDSLRILTADYFAESSIIPAPLLDELSRAILNPLEDVLGFYNTLMIVPDGGLEAIPFEALNWAGEPLRQNHSITYGYSASFFPYSRSKRIFSGNNVVIARSELGGEIIGDEYILNRTDSSRNKEAFLSDISYGDYVVIKSDFQLERKAALNSYFTWGKNSSPNSIQLYELYSQNLPATLFILEGVEVHTAGWLPLIRGLCFAGVGGVIAINPGAESALTAQYYRVLFEGLKHSSPLAAHNQALSFINQGGEVKGPWFATYWGDGGMNPDEAEIFARDNFMQTVKLGNLNLRKGNNVWAIRYYRQALEMAKRLNDVNSPFNLQKLILQSAIGGGIWDAAIEAQSEILKYEIPASAQAGGLANLGYFYLRQDELDSAAFFSQEAGDLYESLGESAAAAAVYLNQGYALEDKGRYLAAEEFASRARVIQAGAFSSDTVKTDIFRAKLLLSAGLALESKEVLSGLEQAETLEAESRYYTYQFLGRSCERLMDYESAQAYFIKADRWAPKGSERLRANAIQGEADILFKTGNLGEALDKVYTARSLFETAGAVEELYLSYNTEGLILLNMGRYSLAGEALSQAYNLVSRTSDRLSEANILRNQARYNIEVGEYRKALSLARQSAEIYQGEGRKLESALDRLTAAGLMIVLKDKPGAQEAMSKAATLNRELNSPGIEIRINMIKLKFSLEESKLKDALVLAEGTYNSAKVQDIPGLLWRAATMRGMVKEGSGDIAGALESYREACRIIIDDMEGSISWQARTVFLDEIKIPFDKLVKGLFASGRREEALSFAGLYRQVRRRNEIRMRGVKLRGGRDYAEAEASLRAKITGLREKSDDLRFKGGNISEKEQLDSEIAGLRKNYFDLLTAVNSQDEIFYQINMCEAVSLPSIQANLDSGRAILYLFQGEERLWGWLVKEDTVVFSEGASKSEDMLKSVKAYRNLLKGIINVEADSRRLYDSLLKPFEAELLGVDYLIISPGEILKEIPFESLTDGEGKGALEKWAISYIENLSDIEIPEKAVSVEDLRIFSVPDYAGREKIQFADKEAASIAFTFPRARIFRGEEASAAQALEALKSADAVHFACHGGGGEETMPDYALYLSPEGNNEGKLSLREVYGEFSNANLVYLSSCGSELSGAGGEEYLDLPGAYLTAGANCVIYSLWKVDDLSASIIAKRFYRNLREGMNYTEALRAARLFLKDEINPHPAYWAGFRLYGNPFLRMKVQ